MSSWRIVFFGTAELACASLAALHRRWVGQIRAVVTQPDRPKGRELKIQPSPVKRLAMKLNLEVWQPERARAAEFVARLREAQPDLIVVAAYGQILPPAILEAPRYGCVNVHASLLPRHRGAAPIQWAILEGDAETGVTIMKMDAGLDTGDILTQQATPILDTDDAQQLHDRLAAMGAELLVATLPDYIAGRILPRPQPADGATYARKITREDGAVDWSQPARSVWNRIRAFAPWPGAFTHLPAGGKRTLLKLWRAAPQAGPVGPPGTVLRADRNGLLVACGEQALLITELQQEGGRRMPTGDFVAGHPIAVGTLLA